MSSNNILEDYGKPAEYLLFNRCGSIHFSLSLVLNFQSIHFYMLVTFAVVQNTYTFA